VQTVFTGVKSGLSISLCFYKLQSSALQLLSVALKLVILKTNSKRNCMNRIQHSFLTTLQTLSDNNDSDNVFRLIKLVQNILDKKNKPDDLLEFAFKTEVYDSIVAPVSELSEQIVRIKPEESNDIQLKLQKFAKNLRENSKNSVEFSSIIRQFAKMEFQNSSSPDTVSSSPTLNSKVPLENKMQGIKMLLDTKNDHKLNLDIYSKLFTCCRTRDKKMSESLIDQLRKNFCYEEDILLHCMSITEIFDQTADETLLGNLKYLIIASDSKIKLSDLEPKVISNEEVIVIKKEFEEIRKKLVSQPANWEQFLLIIGCLDQLALLNETQRKSWDMNSVITSLIDGLNLPSNSDLVKLTLNNYHQRFIEEPAAFAIIYDILVNLRQNPDKEVYSGFSIPTGNFFSVSKQDSVPQLALTPNNFVYFLNTFLGVNAEIVNTVLGNEIIINFPNPLPEFFKGIEKECFSRVENDRIIVTFTRLYLTKMNQFVQKKKAELINNPLDYCYREVIEIFFDSLINQDLTTADLVDLLRIKQISSDDSKLKMCINSLDQKSRDKLEYVRDQFTKLFDSYSISFPPTFGIMMIVMLDSIFLETRAKKSEEKIKLSLYSED
jgi:hypothetical protein